MGRRVRIVYLEPARRDLIDIVDYIRRDRPASGDTWVDEVDRRVGRLRSNPRLGVLPKDARLRRLGYRMLVLGNYIVFYKVVRGAVEIRRVIHGARRYGFLL